MPAMNRRALAAWCAAVLLPAALTALLLNLNPGDPREYVFLYLGVVAVLGLASGTPQALVGAATSFLFVDYLFVTPVHTLQFAQATDLVNLCVFLATAVLVGTLGSRRRAAQLRAEALAGELQQANIELARLDETEREMRVLAESNRIRRDLLANVSHELRTPLAGVLTGVTALQDLHSSAHEKGLNNVAACARRLDRLVSDLLDMTRIEGGALDLHLSDVSLEDAVDAALRRLAQLNPARMVSTDYAPGIDDVTADWERLGQVLDNLLMNADHAAPQQTPITIALQPADGGADVTVRISNQGAPIPTSIREHLFERFVRDPAGTSGTGLGLAIARGLIDAQGGRIRLEDAGDHGTITFAFSLPAVSPEELPA